jgi:hypothetical protein
MFFCIVFVCCTVLHTILCIILFFIFLLSHHALHFLLLPFSHFSFFIFQRKNAPFLGDNFSWIFDVEAVFDFRDANEELLTLLQYEKVDNITGTYERAYVCTYMCA